MIRISRWSLLLESIFALFALWFLCYVNRDYLFILQEYNLFLNSSSFFWRHLTHVGGLLDYIASFVSQFFLRPFVGGGILVCLLLAIRKLTAKLFQFRSDGLILSFVPAFLLLRIITQPGYDVFADDLNADMRTSGLYAVFIGVFLALSFATGYSVIASPTRRGVFCSLGTILLYYAAGFYGLLGTLLCLFCECSFPREKRRFLCFVFPILCGLLTPYFLFWMKLTKTNLSNAYRVGLPGGVIKYFNFMLCEFGLLFLVLLVFAGFRIAWNVQGLRKYFNRERQFPVKKQNRQTADLENYSQIVINEIDLRFAVLNGILLVLMCCAVYSFSHTRGDFLVTAKMCRMTCEEDWEGILKIHYENENPACPIVVFRQLALFKLDRIADDVFTFPTIAQAREGRLQGQETNRVFGDHILFEYGLVNTAFQSAMVQYAMKESTISNLRILALCSMANEEYEVAKKYLRLIQQTCFYRDWVQNHLDYIEFRRCGFPIEGASPAVKAIALRFRENRRLMPVVNKVEKYYDRIENIIMRGFLRDNIQEATSEVRKMYLVQLLLFKDLNSFRKHFELWADELYRDRIPRHFQEALVMGVTSDDVDAQIAQYGLSPDWGKQFSSFMQILETTVQPGQPVAPDSLIHREFGDTYWFYFFLK